VSQLRNLLQISRSLVFIAFNCGLFVFPTVWGQANSLTTVSTAKEAIRQLFPELQGKGLPLLIRDGSTLDGKAQFLSFGLEVLQPNHQPLAQEQDVCAEAILLSAEFEFTQRKQQQRIFALNIGGAEVDSDKRRRLGQLIDDHAEWSDKEIEEAITRAGARFGPSSKDQFVSVLPLTTLRLLLGNMQVSSVGFETRDKLQLQEHLPSAILLWNVLLQGEQTEYQALFEPFNGRLVSLKKIPPVP
jgi:hypothetical protein